MHFFFAPFICSRAKCHYYAFFIFFLIFCLYQLSDIIQCHQTPVASLGGPPRVTPSRGWHPNKRVILFGGWIYKHTGQTISWKDGECASDDGVVGLISFRGTAFPKIFRGTAFPAFPLDYITGRIFDLDLKPREAVRRVVRSLSLSLSLSTLGHGWISIITRRSYFTLSWSSEQRRWRWYNGPHSEPTRGGASCVATWNARHASIVPRRRRSWRSWTTPQSAGSDDEQERRRPTATTMRVSALERLTMYALLLTPDA